LKKVSIVIPVYNEVENLNALISAVGQAMLPTGQLAAAERRRELTRQFREVFDQLKPTTK
jgi:hypothetical protein